MASRKQTQVKDNEPEGTPKTRRVYSRATKPSLAAQQAEYQALSASIDRRLDILLARADLLIADR